MAPSVKNVLIVEDDKDIRDSLSEILALEGYDVTTANNGLEGLEMLHKLPRPCLVLLDLMMPVMNGWQFLDEKQQDRVLVTIPVVVVSAAGDRAKTANASGFIKKPIDIGALVDEVRKYCA